MQRVARPSLLPTCWGTRPIIYRSFATTRLARNVVNELQARGMVADLTSRSVTNHVERPVTVYLGVDPSASSLHVGNLAALVGLLHFRLQGHTAIALVCPSARQSSYSAFSTDHSCLFAQIGGATGSVGDPSGRSTERNALSSSQLDTNVRAITSQVVGFLDRGVPFAQSRNRRRDSPESESSLGQIRVENNLDWLGGMGLLQFLSSVGKMARISTMLSRESTLILRLSAFHSVKSRLESSSGLSFTEFSYQLLQAFDFLTLHQRHNCTIQLGGSDQLGNIMSGIEMIRKNQLQAHTLPVDATPPTTDVEPRVGGDHEDPAYGITMPLLTTASGEKFGKSAGNAIWLDPGMTSPFELYQFFLRTTDEEVHKYLKIFTFVRVIELEAIMADHKAHPEKRVAQKILAAEATELVHGALGLRQAIAATSLFYGSDPATLDLAPIIEALEAKSTSNSTQPEAQLPSMILNLPKEEFLGQALEKIVIASGLATSKSTATARFRLAVGPCHSQTDLIIYGCTAQARRAIDQGLISINGTKVAPKKHQRSIEVDDLLLDRVVLLKMGKQGNKVVVLE
ncbi:BQ5605_C010g05852 [Microbotryum silenes-dioicae]|uniref:tyrosine--tRNA ligase n=1 Tax=Microbotryum silenes-dioicae TaxID=796604 RepID=A0A2X0MAY0_9BASI|nr:BQ5605_C010g05852 [Microbotryum silenes-dioicae]